MTNQFYKMPANILQTESIQKMLKEPGALAQFGLTMLMWLTIQESRDKRVSARALKNTFSGVSSNRQRQRVLDSGFFGYDPSTDTYGINPQKLHTGAHPAAHSTAHSAAHTAGHTPVPFLLELEKELDIEEEENTRETSTATSEKFSNSQNLDQNNLNPETAEGMNPETAEGMKLLDEVRTTKPDHGELWEGVLLCCPDQSLRRMMAEHWEMTVDFFEKHLMASGKMAEVKDMKSLCDILREMVQPAHPLFGGLKLFLMQEAKSKTEKAFDDWLATQTNILLMREPLTFQQFSDLVQLGFEATHVRSTIERLNNYPSTPTRYVSAFQTAKDWLQNPLH